MKLKSFTKKHPFQRCILRVGQVSRASEVAATSEKNSASNALWWMKSHENGRKGWPFFVAQVFWWSQWKGMKSSFFESWDPFHQINKCTTKTKKGQTPLITPIPLLETQELFTAEALPLSFSAQEWNLPSRLLPQGNDWELQNHHAKKRVFFVDW